MCCVATIAHHRSSRKKKKKGRQEKWNNRISNIVQCVFLLLLSFAFVHMMDMCWNCVSDFFVLFQTICWIFSEKWSGRKNNNKKRRNLTLELRRFMKRIAPKPKPQAGYTFLADFTNFGVWKTQFHWLNAFYTSQSSFFVSTAILLSTKTPYNFNSLQIIHELWIC